MNLKKKFFALLTALALLGGALAMPASAASLVDLPDLPSDQCVVDDANMLSADTESWLNSVNGILQSQCSGATIAVLTLDGVGNSTTEVCAQTAFNTWGVGSKTENNGVLILLVRQTPQYSDGDYFMLLGTGLQGTDLEKQVSTILQNDMEDDFAAGNYDAAIQRTVLTVSDDLAGLYNTSVSLPAVGAAGNTQGGTTNDTNGGWDASPEAVRGSTFGEIIGGILSTILMIVLCLLLLVLIILPVGRGFGWGWGPFSWGWGPFGWFGGPRYYHHHGPRGPRGPGGFGGPGGPHGPGPGGPHGPSGGHHGGGSGGFGGGFGGMGGGMGGGGMGRGGMGGGFGGGMGGGFGGMGGGGSFGGGGGRGR